jgi:hypothetical protein
MYWDENSYSISCHHFYKTKQASAYQPKTTEIGAIFSEPSTSMNFARMELSFSNNKTSALSRNGHRDGSIESSCVHATSPRKRFNDDEEATDMVVSNQNEEG